MITLEIPGRDDLRVSHVVFDFNGTIALDGKLVEGVASRMRKLADMASVHVLTADTFGTAAAECESTGAAVETFPAGAAAPEKRAIVEALAGDVVCIGNGFNDAEMFDAADLSIAILGGEGAWAGLIAHADIVVTDVCDACDLLLNPQRLKATLRW